MRWFDRSAEIVRDRLKEAAGMHCGETAETSKVGYVQREYMNHTVDAHGRGQSRIVRLNTQYLVLDDNPAHSR
ncbi:MAG: hypothetical protein WAK21_05975 [Candidatus Sulfotelmatobacter sp.]